MQKKSVLTIGFFDGMHLGHQRLIKHVLKYSSLNNLVSKVITFDKVAKNSQGLIYPIAKKVELIRNLGVEEVKILSFERIKMFSPEKFFEKCLLPQKVGTIFVGEDFCFGYKKSGTIDVLKSLCKRYKVLLFVINDVCFNDNENEKAKRISSSVIRKYISEANFLLVERLLGREYFITGKIVKGKGLGKKLGVPTINFEISSNLILPRGILAGECRLNNKKYFSVADVGNSPTVKNTKKIICEVHILDKKIGKVLKSIFFRPIKKIRDEKKFNSLDELKLNMFKDIAVAKKILINKTGGYYAS